MLPTDYEARKGFPLMTFLGAYFPDMIEALVGLSVAGNKQHKVDVPKYSPFYLEGDRIAWDRSKSTEELETLMRHLWDHIRAKRSGNDAALYDTDGALHITKVMWRAGAEGQKTIERLRGAAALDELGLGRIASKLREPTTDFDAPQECAVGCRSGIGGNL
jgi:hypothetical protein